MWRLVSVLYEILYGKYDVRIVCSEYIKSLPGINTISGFDFPVRLSSFFFFFFFFGHDLLFSLFPLQSCRGLLFCNGLL